MKCSLGMLCQPLKVLGLHAHKSSSTRRASRPAAKKRKVVKATVTAKKVVKNASRLKTALRTKKRKR